MMQTDRLPEETDAPIEIIFVDDDREWARLTAEDIQAEASGINITVVGSARECLDRLSGQAAPDCVVSDYQMPGLDGIELLERVREEYPKMPFVLVTSQGSESVAARAMDAGVDDYIVKDIRRDQSTKFISTIRTTVGQYRLRQAIEESEQRYRTVTEQSRDAVMIVRAGRLLFANKRLSTLTGRDRTALQGDDIIDSVVHPDDRARMHEALADWAETDETQPVREIRIVRPDGTVRQCEYTGNSVEYNDEMAMLISIRDVTQRNQRERELRWERELNRTINEALAESSTRQTLEDRVTDQLHRHGYALAWCGEQIDTELVCRSVSGDRTYLDTINRTVTARQVGPPDVLAAQTGDPQFVQDVTAVSGADWTDIATRQDYQSGAAVPLSYNNVSYGVLGVYHKHADRFNETEQRLLRELTDTVAFAIHSLETRGALTATQPVGVTVGLSDHYLGRLARDGVFSECETVKIAGTVRPDDETTVQYIEATGGVASDLADAIAGSPSVEQTTIVIDNEVVRIEVTLAGPVPESHLAARGVVVESTTIEADAAVVSFALPTRADLRPTVDSLQTAFGEVSVRAVSKRDVDSTREDSSFATDNLTEKQRAALKTAYYHGYFKQPRESNATEVAEVLGVSHPTFLHHLRAAQRKQFGEQFG
jgi:PAS domain S-box